MRWKLEALGTHQPVCVQVPLVFLSVTRWRCAVRVSIAPAFATVADSRKTLTGLNTRTRSLKSAQRLCALRLTLQALHAAGRC